MAYIAILGGFCGILSRRSERRRMVFQFPVLFHLTLGGQVGGPRRDQPYRFPGAAADGRGMRVHHIIMIVLRRIAQCSIPACNSTPPLNPHSKGNAQRHSNPAATTATARTPYPRGLSAVRTAPAASWRTSISPADSHTESPPAVRQTLDSDFEEKRTGSEGPGHRVRRCAGDEFLARHQIPSDQIGRALDRVTDAGAAVEAELERTAGRAGSDLRQDEGTVKGEVVDTHGLAIRFRGAQRVEGESKPT